MDWMIHQSASAELPSMAAVRAPAVAALLTVR